MNFDAENNNSPADRAAFYQWLTEQTVAELQAARNNKDALRGAVSNYVKLALAAHLNVEEIEDLLGINDPCIMDLAQLSEADEEAVVDVFEELCS